MCSLSQQFYTLAVALGIVCLSSAMPQNPQQLQEGPHALLDIETPNQFSYNSPLAQPDSLRNKPYFDFLSTLYAHDSAKTNLFRNRPQRSVELQPEPELKADEQQLAAADQPKSRRRDRKRRAIVFRPLFVYQQREIKKKEIAARRRSDEAQRRNYYKNYKRV
ncbi:PREDICTED: uncharacterized protein LOC108615642 [Drosophila arizonae]|uniref:Uncharacterized protein n=2 Tax=mojavensis species complex TaxID=198037 RepID=B4KRG0_DROMO|nr:PREDICTED: uncharacterized protein LOC108615642 [Drosophila arizonae]EDW09376.2 uncharacterized protein Dmoj_GI19070 [Drosophila mojavensis]